MGRQAEKARLRDKPAVIAKTLQDLWLVGRWDEEVRRQRCSSRGGKTKTSDGEKPTRRNGRQTTKTHKSQTQRR